MLAAAEHFVDMVEVAIGCMKGCGSCWDGIPETETTLTE